jgi:hypothetical protein
MPRHLGCALLLFFGISADSHTAIHSARGRWENVTVWLRPSGDRYFHTD